MPHPLSAQDILAKLVSFPTVSRDSNLALIDWVDDYLAGFGVASVRVPNADGSKAALYAQAGPAVAGGVILSGHSDVVPVDGQDWTTDPWVLAERDGRLYGRGTCDMKGFVALALAAVPMALEAGVKRPLQIALSYGEELGLTGCVPMIAEMAAKLPRAAAVIVGEPSLMKVVSGHKGGVNFDVRIKGFEVHSSIQHTGVSAIHEAGRVLHWLNAQNAALAAARPAPMAARFDPPFTTVHSGTIHGGTAANITAADCRLDLGFRVVPGEDAEDWARAFEAEAARIEAGMKAVRPEAGITLVRRFTAPPLVPEDRGAAETLARRLTGDNSQNVVSYGTEAGHFQAHGYSAVVCGPGSIAQAHQPDEYLERSEFEAGLAFMRRLVAGLAA
jgi:acetylornithine deacetylase